ncbi:MAG: flippase-like domain-containing protein [Acidobacteriota bacterium]|nr:flippase-like domain-containing protein [Acidobacteriota bacterium]
MTAPAGDINKVRKRVFLIVTCALSLICLIWAVHGLNLQSLRSDIAHLDWRWVAIAMISDLLIYIWQGWRWALVLAPIKRVSSMGAVRAIFVGLFANEVLPLRAGEIIRCYLLGRANDLPVSVTLASALIERIFDGIWLVACLFVTIRYVHLPKRLVAGGIILGVLILAVGILLAIAMYWRQQTLDALLNARWFGWIHVLIEDLHLIGHSRYLYYAFFMSIPVMLLQVAPIYAMMRAYSHLSTVSMGAAFTLMVVMRLGTVIPQGPGNLGTYNSLIIMALHIFGVERHISARFSLILWTAVTIPLLLAGFIALAITGGTIGNIHREARAGMKRTATPVPEDDPAIK